MREKLMYPPTVMRYEGDVPHVVPYELFEEYSRTKKVGDVLCCFVGAPGTGRIVERITRIDATGIYGVVIEDTSRELTRWEVI